MGKAFQSVSQVCWWCRVRRGVCGCGGEAVGREGGGGDGEVGKEKD